MSDFELDREIDGVVSMTIIDKQRNELLNLLDQANDGWLIFMDKVGQFLGPIASKAGRPTKAEIKATMLGALGFDTWREMIEADREKNGLGWKFSTYQAWRKAYSIVNSVQGLRDEQLTPTEINRLATQVKALNDGELPKSLDSWNAEVEGIQKAKEQAKVDNELSLKKELAEASQTLSKTISELDKQSVELDAEKRLNKSLEAQIAELREQARVNNENLNLLTKNVATKDDDLKRTAGERNKARESVVNATKKIKEQEQGLKAKVAEVKKLTHSLSLLKNRSLIKRIFNQD